MITTSLDLLNDSHNAIVDAGTDAEDRVYKPGDWPSQPGGYPIIKMRLLAENRQSISGSTAPEFTTTATIRFVGEVSEPAQLDDLGAAAAEAALWKLKRQIDVAVVNSYPLMKRIQNIPSIRAQLAFNSEGATHLAGIQLDMDLEFYEGPESFAPVKTVDLNEASLADTNHAPIGALVSLQP